MNNKKNGPFRTCVARYAKSLRKNGCRTRKEIGPFIVAFCDGWTALSEEMDKVTKKYEIPN